MNGGDQLARGSKSANFPASDGKVSQEKWDFIFQDWSPEKPSATPLPQDVIVPEPASNS